MSASSATVDRETDQIADLFYPLYELAFSGQSDFVSDMDRKLAEARMNETVELFLARAIGYGTLSGLALWGIGMLVGYLVFTTGIVSVGTLIGLPVPNETLYSVIEAVKIPSLVLGTGVIFGLTGFAIGFGGLVAIPYTRASSRKREINMLLPDAISYMFALSTGGLNQLEILESMAQADDVYGEVALEFRSIVQETKYFDVDYRTAVRNRSLETPSDELSQFLTDMLSIINSGGDMTDFLEDKKNRHMRTAKQEQETNLETLELFGEMYMTLSLFPLLLIIVVVIMSMLGQADQDILYATIYGLIPGVGLAFLVLVSTVKQDEPGDGYLSLSNERDPDAKEPGLLDMGLVEEYVGERSVFSRIKTREGTHITAQLLRRPHLFFRDNPLYSLGITVPVAIALQVSALRAGVAPTSIGGIIDNPIYSTFLYAYVPLYVIGVPTAIFYEWNVYSRHLVVDKLSENLRKLSSANDTGLTLLESLRTVSETSRGKLGEEFARIHAKVNYGTSLEEALVEFNNKYHIPRLSRTVNLVSKAQEASSEISAVLTTAAQASENQDDIDRERKSRTRMQVVIIIMTFLTLLAVMAILKVSFLDVMAGLSSQASDGGGAAGGVSFGGSIDIQLLTLLFFHAVTLQGILAGFIAGYIRDARILSGVKFAIVLPTISLVVFAFI
ncbi:type II secretion system F family protein [Halanaeroarchaeum sulfurireducens]|uniref:Type II secretion system protein F n=1 Tax=Halanaeroarchaeum sulfurireducens TaxID=1604004 RepID=A0A0F7P9Y4_9EURY|nr:type II secretion system F family protein [Halanaeroarchaeum sulfurireducens]AKH97597.1 type II secretion system protein F [Halanaeroarchaeum sulfurireducens]ALG81993.1 type II secretion system protein F [Halanaeroarchaeum sulfurireducens]